MVTGAVMKKLIIFDAYGTLIAAGAGYREAVRRIPELTECGVNPELFCEEWKILHRQHKEEANGNGYLIEAEIFRKDLSVLYSRYGIAGNRNKDADFLQTALGVSKAFEGAADAVNQLKKKYRVIIGADSDTEPLLLNIRRNGMEPDGIYSSEDLKIYKPDRRFYQKMLHSCGGEAENTIYIGNSYHEDVEGPASAGIPSILIDRRRTHTQDGKHTVQPLAVVHSLYNLVQLLEKMQPNQR